MKREKRYRLYKKKHNKPIEYNQMTNLVKLLDDHVLNKSNETVNGIPRLTFVDIQSSEILSPDSGGQIQSKIKMELIFLGKKTKNDDEDSVPTKPVT